MLRFIKNVMLGTAMLSAAGATHAGWGEFSAPAQGTPLVSPYGGPPQFCQNNTVGDSRWLSASVQVFHGFPLENWITDAVSAQALPWDPAWLSTVGVIWTEPDTWLGFNYAEKQLKVEERAYYYYRLYGDFITAQCRVR